MKSIPLLLYLVSAGLFGFAGWTVYEMLPMWKASVREKATKSGMEDGQRGLTLGKGQGGVTRSWVYHAGTAGWWAGLKEVNLVGKLPPPPPENDDAGKPPPPPPPPPIKPLEEILEIVSIVYDGQQQGRGGNSHVIVRYKPEANVQPPEWYLRENAPPTASTGPAPMRPGDAVPAARVGGRNAPRPVAPAPPRPTSAMPTSMVGREILQKLWVDDGGDERRSSHLWPEFQDVRLVRVAADAQAAFFVRKPLASPNGEAPAEPNEEELVKTAMPLSQDVLRELRRMRGQPDEAPKRDPNAVASMGTWTEVEETTLIHGVRHIGKKDAQRFEQNPDRMFEQIHVDTYVSKSSSTRGLIVRNVDPKLAQQFGIAPGEVLIELNGRPVQTQAQAIQQGKRDYERGVRTFVTKWLANGQEIERTYQAPDK